MRNRTPWRVSPKGEVKYRRRLVPDRNRQDSPTTPSGEVPLPLGHGDETAASPATGRHHQSLARSLTDIASATMDNSAKLFTDDPLRYLASSSACRPAGATIEDADASQAAFQPSPRYRYLTPHPAMLRCCVDFSTSENLLSRHQGRQPQAGQRKGRSSSSCGSCWVGMQREASGLHLDVVGEETVALEVSSNKAVSPEVEEESRRAHTVVKMMPTVLPGCIRHAGNSVRMFHVTLGANREGPRQAQHGGSLLENGLGVE